MYIKDIKWLDERGKEAILKVVNNGEYLFCFSCPCFYDIGDTLTEPLECLDVDNITLSEIRENKIEKMGESFKYTLLGKVIDLKNGIVEIFGFKLHINEKKIPGDIVNGMYIQFVVSRIDVW